MLFAFVTSAFITGLSGALYGIYLSFVSVEGFPFLLSIEALAILIVGGLGSALGAVLGTTLSRSFLDRLSDRQFYYWTRRVILVLGTVYVGQGVWLMVMR